MPQALAPDRRDRLRDALDRLSGPTGLAWLVAFATAPRRAAEAARYVGASAVSLVFDTCVFMALIGLGGVAAPLAGALGYMSGMALNYAISVRYIFSTRLTGKSGRRLVLEYALSGLMGVTLTAVLIAIATEILNAPPLIAKAFSVAVTFVTVYLVRSAGVFAPRAVRP